MLLTGAGFAKNWGGFLAREVWERMLASPTVRGNEVLRKVLLDNPEDFEAALAFVRLKSPKIAALMETAVLEVFEEQDDNETRDWFDFQSEKFHDFTAKFRGSDGTAMFFTLNQDLLVERRWRDGELWAPGVGNLALSEARARLSEEYRERVAVDPAVELRVGAVNYLKLHGSFVWNSASGNALLVAGADKRTQIAEQFAILAQYLKLFRLACEMVGARLVVIGYSFRDPHINAIIAGAARNGLELAVMDTRSATSLKNQLRQDGYPEIWSAVRDYCSTPLMEILRECPGSREMIASSTGVR